ncbi:zf-HC2 domain-containing protein [Azoarcus sp. L1K30]|uniref:zf-HC2 domain-containing protein n=1 Tax=Azoarcus sp. L1K30 TaxID=2820277 RepID=UPI001B830957|nr:zf-HC2 domain-containing protein [Azoarcus sp. L1K30]MBR0565871.1 zf-HC2 domain-containing protein [Azoarcus sp. L1K30]
MLTCKEATRLSSEALDRELNLRERLSLRMHILMCTGCTNFEEQMRHLRKITRRYASGEASSGDDDRDHR